MLKARYLFDVLYGRVTLPDFLWEAMGAPEVQRLREVRLCNINSLCLTGGANVNRYEHVVGTAHLAHVWTKTVGKDLPPIEQRRLILAALLHDVGSAPFGHSAQYVLDPSGFKHESLYEIALPQARFRSTDYEFRLATLEPIFFGVGGRLASLIGDEKELRAISDVIAGEGPLAPLINGSVDFDNIDNVYRLAYHIGLTRDTEAPLRLAMGLRSDHDGLILTPEAIPDLKQWYETRRRLYHYLLLNLDEFSAKCMLQEALEYGQERREEIVFRWSDVDFQLVQKLSALPQTKDTIRRLMIGDLWGPIGLFSTGVLETYDRFLDVQQRRELEITLSKELQAIGRATPGLRFLAKASVALHAIKDVNKTEREVRARTTSGERVSVGTASRRILVGVFLRNVGASALELKHEVYEDPRLRRALQSKLGELLTDPQIKELQPYAEI